MSTKTPPFSTYQKVVKIKLGKMMENKWWTVCQLSWNGEGDWGGYILGLGLGLGFFDNFLLDPRAQRINPFNNYSKRINIKNHQQISNRNKNFKLLNNNIKAKGASSRVYGVASTLYSLHPQGNGKNSIFRLFSG